MAHDAATTYLDEGILRKSLLLLLLDVRTKNTTNNLQIPSINGQRHNLMVV
jgi:hypothetical protein